MINAESLDEMKSEVATDIYQTCLMMRRRIARIVQAKSFSNVDIDSVVGLLEILDYIDKKLETYKKKYLKLKGKVLSDIEKQKLKLEDREKAAQQKEASKDSKKDKKKSKKKRKVTSSDEEEEKTEGQVDLLEMGDPQEAVKKQKVKKPKKKSDSSSEEEE